MGGSSKMKWTSAVKVRKTKWFSGPFAIGKPGKICKPKWQNDPWCVQKQLHPLFFFPLHSSYTSRRLRHCPAAVWRASPPLRSRPGECCYHLQAALIRALFHSRLWPWEKSSWLDEGKGRKKEPSVTLKITNGQSTSQWKSNYNLLLLVFLSILPPPHPPLSVCTSPLKQWRNPALLSLAFPPRDLQWKEAKRAKLLRLEAATIRCLTCPAEE